MPVALVIPNEYGYVLAVAALSTTVNIYHSILTGGRRKAAAIPYPNSYATAEEAEKSPAKLAFNCAQRAHANFTENYTPFLIGLAIGGLRFPTVAAGLGASWIVARFMYAWGYARVGVEYSKNGRGRLIGAWSSAPLIALIGMAIWSGYQMVIEA